MCGNVLVQSYIYSTKISFHEKEEHCLPICTTWSYDLESLTVRIRQLLNINIFQVPWPEHKKWKFYSYKVPLGAGWNGFFNTVIAWNQWSEENRWRNQLHFRFVSRLKFQLILLLGELLSDIGGIFGFFLGVSLLQCCSSFWSALNSEFSKQNFATSALKSNFWSIA